MPKGFNSVLFDFDSIIDREISLIRFIAAEYKDSTGINSFIDIDAIANMDIDIMRLKRIYGNEDLFRSLLVGDANKDNYESIINILFDRDQKEIFEGGYAFNTIMTTLISAFRKAGNGVIRTTIRCDNEQQKEYIRTFDREVSIIVKERKNVDTSKYGRLIVGHYKSALEYKLEEPKSIAVLNFRENFDSRDNILLNPELVISLGDIHKIEIISAFREDEFING